MINKNATLLNKNATNFSPLGGRRTDQNHATKSVYKDFFQSLTSESRAFHVLFGLDLPCQLLSLFERDGTKIGQSFAVSSQIDLSTHKNFRCVWTIFTSTFVRLHP